MRRILTVIVGLLIIGFSIWQLPRHLQEAKVGRSTSFVQVRISRLPPSCEGNRRKTFEMRIEYQGQEYAKSISAPYCASAQVGQLIRMKHLPQYAGVFLFEDQTGIGGLCASILLLLFGLYCALFDSGLWQLRKPK